MCIRDSLYWAAIGIGNVVSTADHFRQQKHLVGVGRELRPQRLGVAVFHSQRQVGLAQMALLDHRCAVVGDVEAVAPHHVDTVARGRPRGRGPRAGRADRPIAQPALSQPVAQQRRSHG